MQQTPEVVLPKDLIQPFEDEIHPLFWANLWAIEKVIINQGGSWSGKTECIMRVLFAYAITFPNLIITVATNTIPKLKEDALRIGEQLIAPTYLKLIDGEHIETPSKIFPFVVQYHKTDRKIIFSNGSEISFKSFENEEQAKGEKRDILYFVEMTRTTFGIWYELYLRTRIRCFGCYNPTSSFYVHKNILGNPKEFISTQVIRSWHAHNPYLPAEKHAELERISDPIMWKVYARGLTGMLRGTIYPDWVMVEDDEFGGPDGVIWGTDWAFSEDKRADPSACVRIKRNPINRPDLDYIVDQVAYGQGIAAPDIATAQKALGYKNGQMDYCDHALQQIYEKQLNGITGAVQALKGPGSILAGILFVKRKRVGVTRRSVSIWMEQASYKFLEVEGIVTNTPIDEYNHAMDAIRYAIYTDALANGYT